MSRLVCSIAVIERELAKSKLHRDRMKKRVENGPTHASHLAYNDGFVTGLEMALAICKIDRKVEEVQAQKKAESDASANG